MSTATPRDEFAPLLRVLCGPGDAGRRLAAAAEIKAIIVRADTQFQVQQVFVSLLQHLEPLLFDPSEQICRCIPPLLGALGAAQRPNLQGFFGWFVEAAQRIGPADEQLPSGGSRPSRWNMLLAALNECLTLLLCTDLAAAGHALATVPGVVHTVLFMLKSAQQPTLLTSLLPLLATLGGHDAYAPVRPPRCPPPRARPCPRPPARHLA